MKKLILTVFALLCGCFYMAAQDNPRTSESQETLDDKLQQQPPRPAQRENEQNARISAEREALDKEILENEKKQQTLESVKEKTKTVEKTRTLEKKAVPHKK